MPDLFDQIDINEDTTLKGYDIFDEVTFKGGDIFDNIASPSDGLVRPKTSGLGLMKAFGRGIAETATKEIPSMLGGATQFIGETAARPRIRGLETPIIDPIREAIASPSRLLGYGVGKAGKFIKEGSESIGKEMYGPEPQDQSGLERIVYQGTKMFGPSVGSALAGPILGPVIFGLSQAQQSVDSGLETAKRLEAEGDIEGAEKAREATKGYAPIITGAIEFVGEHYGTKYLGKLLGLGRGEIAKRTGKEIVTDFLRTLGVEIGTEAGQAGTQALTEKISGIRPEAEPIKEALDVTGPTAFMTLLTGGLATGANRIGGKPTELPEIKESDKQEILSAISTGLNAGTMTVAEVKAFRSNPNFKTIGRDIGNVLYDYAKARENVLADEAISAQGDDRKAKVDEIIELTDIIKLGPAVQSAQVFEKAFADEERLRQSPMGLELLREDLGSQEKPIAETELPSGEGGLPKPIAGIATEAAPRPEVPTTPPIPETATFKYFDTLTGTPVPIYELPDGSSVSARKLEELGIPIPETPEAPVVEKAPAAPPEAEKKEPTPALAPAKEEAKGSVAESLRIAQEQTDKRQAEYRDKTDKFPDGTIIGGWTKQTIAGDVFWLKGKRQTTDILVEAGNKPVDKALADFIPVKAKEETTKEGMVSAIDSFFGEEAKLTPDNRKKLESQLSMLESAIKDGSLTGADLATAKQRVGEIKDVLTPAPAKAETGKEGAKAAKPEKVEPEGAQEAVAPEKAAVVMVNLPGISGKRPAQLIRQMTRGKRKGISLKGKYEVTYKGKKYYVDSYEEWRPEPVAEPTPKAETAEETKPAESKTVKGDKPTTALSAAPEAKQRIKDRLKDERGSISLKKIEGTPLYDDLLTVSKDILSQGHTSYRAFRAQMHKTFSDVWNKIKAFMRELWDMSKRILASERGSLGGMFAQGAPIMTKETQDKLRGSVVTKDGKPWEKPGDELTLYHGTDVAISEFKDRITWFSPDPKLAADYAGERAIINKTSESVIPGYAATKKPYMVDERPKHRNIGQLLSGAVEQAKKENMQFNNAEALAKFRKVQKHWNDIGLDNSEVRVFEHWNKSGDKGNQLLADFLEELGFDAITFEENGNITYGLLRPSQIIPAFTETNITRAQRMYDEGKTDDEVFKATGWVRGPEGKWMFRIDDSGAKLNINLITEKLKSGKTVKTLKLHEVLDHKDLFDAYLELKNITVSLNPGGKASMYMKGQGERPGIISIAVQPYTKSGENVFKETLLHEISHAIQDIEGFARGGSPGAMADTVSMMDDIKKLESDLAKAEKDEDAGKTFAGGRAQQLRYDLATRRAILEHQNYRNLPGEIYAREAGAGFTGTPGTMEGIPRSEWIVKDGAGTSFTVDKPYGKLSDSDFRDAHEAFMEIYDSLIYKTVNSLKKSKEGDTQGWQTAPFARVKKIWSDFSKLGFVRDESGLNKIAEQVVKNITQLKINTELAGHEQVSPEELLEPYGLEITEEENDRLDTWLQDPETGQWRISDYAMDSLLDDAYHIIAAKNSKDKLLAIDRVLNRVHQRGDIASLFIEGGSKALSELSGVNYGTSFSIEKPEGIDYPKAGKIVDGRTVLDDIPNQDSIEASLDDWEVLPGIREVPLSDFGLTGKHYSVEGTKRIADLASQIKASKKISPLIVVIDNEGPYILEGATRAEALKRLKAKSFPAMVIKDLTEKPEVMMSIAEPGLTAEQFAEKYLNKAITKELEKPENVQKKDSIFEGLKDKWFGNKDWEVFKNSVEATVLQDRIKEILGKKRYDKEAKDIDQAIHIYLDLKRNPDHLTEYYDKQSPEQKRIIDLAQSVERNPELLAIAEYIRTEYDKLSVLAKSADVIYNILENYVGRAWKQPSGKLATENFNKFKTKSRHAKHRVFETILEGQTKGFELAITGATNNLNLIKDEVARIIEDKKLLKSLKSAEWKDSGEKVLTSVPLRDGIEREKINHPNFVYWEFATKVDLRETEVDKATGLAIGDKVRAYDRTNIGNVTEINNGKVTVHFINKKEGTEATKVFDLSGGGKDKLKKVTPRGLNFIISDDGTVLERRPLYAPIEVAKSLNKILGTSKLKGKPGIDTITKYNAVFKSWILVTSFFHHLAFMRSYIFGTRKKTLKEYNPITMYKEGQEAIKKMGEEIELLVKNGLTIGKMQDWEEATLRREDTIFGKILDRNTTSKAIKDKINELRERQADFLFRNFGAGLKAQAALIEYRNALKEHPEMEPADRAKMVANLINDDFGGLHLGRMERDPTIQHIFRLIALAPDWCVDPKTRAMTKTGWKYHHELEIGKDEIMAFDPKTKALRWSKLNDKYVNDQYSGKMVQIKNVNRSILMTPEHTCYVYNSTKKKYEIVKAKGLQTNHQIPRCAEFPAPETAIYDDMFVRLVGWIVTDGYVKKSTNKLANGDQREYRYGKIVQSKPEMVEALKGLNLPYHTDKFNSDHDKFFSNHIKHVFTIPADQFKRMEKEGISDGLTWEFLSKLTKDQRQILYDTMMMGDGTGQKRFCGKEKEVFYMTMLQNMMGLPTTFYQQEENCWRTRWITRGKGISCWGHHNNKSEIDYNGTIWCPSVDTGFWLAEREGMVFITGNTESNVRTMTKAFRAGGKEETALYRKFWASVLTKGLTATILANLLLGLGDDDDAIKRFKEAWKAGNLRWLDVDITPIYQLLHGKTNARKYFSLFGHLKDPMKFISHPIRSAHHKGSVVYRTFHEAMAGVDWKGQRFTTLQELIGIDDKGVYLTTKKDKYKIGDIKGGKFKGQTVTYEGKGGPIEIPQVPSYMIGQLRGIQPIQIQNMIAWLQGEIDGFDALARSLGVHTSSTYVTEKSLENEFVDRYIKLRKNKESINILRTQIINHNKRQKRLDPEKAIELSWHKIATRGNKMIRAELIGGRRKKLRVAQ